VPGIYGWGFFALRRFSNTARKKPDRETAGGSLEARYFLYQKLLPAGRSVEVNRGRVSTN